MNRPPLAFLAVVGAALLAGTVDDATLVVATAGGVLVVATGPTDGSELHAAASTSSPTDRHRWTPAWDRTITGGFCMATSSPNDVRKP